MDSLLKQMGSKYLGPRDNTDPRGHRRDSSSLPPHKSQSFRERKPFGNWLGRQFSHQMSRGNELFDDRIEHATAVAAAAFAICSVEESKMARPRTKIDRPEMSSFPRMGVEDVNRRTPPPRLEPNKILRAFTRNLDVARDPEEASDEKLANSKQQKQKPIENRTYPSPPHVDDISDNRRTGTEKPLPIPRPPTPPISRKPLTAPIRTTPQETKADLWEKAEMAKIQERYQRVNETISYWESKKREKALRKFEASQTLGTKKSQREKGRRKFEEDMEFIKQIAADARNKADHKKKNEILKANQKADIIRQTGDLPVSCYCC